MQGKDLAVQGTRVDSGWFSRARVDFLAVTPRGLQLPGSCLRSVTQLVLHRHQTRHQHHHHHHHHCPLQSLPLEQKFPIIRHTCTILTSTWNLRNSLFLFWGVEVFGIDFWWLDVSFFDVTMCTKSQLGTSGIPPNKIVKHIIPLLVTFFTHWGLKPAPNILPRCDKSSETHSYISQRIPLSWFAGSVQSNHHYHHHHHHQSRLAVSENQYQQSVTTFSCPSTIPVHLAPG